MPLSVSVPPGFFGSINTGNSQFDSDLHNGLAMASSLLANAALSAVPQISAYNTLVGVLNTAALISSGQVVAAIARGAPLAVAQTLGFGPGSTLHGGAAFTGYTVSGLSSTLGAVLPARNCGHKAPFPPLPFNFWIDPSGRVLAQGGRPLAGARVLLRRSATAKGRLVSVPTGSAIMSPANRRNPSITDSLGQFGWNVEPGYYEIQATHRGCRAAQQSSRI